MSNKTERLIKQINKDNLIILEGSISVLSALNSDYSKIVKIILLLDLHNRNTEKILSTANYSVIEYFSEHEFNEFENIINNSNFAYSLGKTHGGIIALAEKRKFLSPEDLIAQSPQTLAIIEGIEDPYNLGYAVRALYTQGTDGLIIPERDFGFSESIIEKASTGTFSKMPIAVFSSAKDIHAKINLINLLKSEKFRIYCLNHKAPAESKAEVHNIFDVKFADKTVFIIGGEKRGISRDFINNADEIARIPYAKDFSHSLAAQTAATIASYEIHRQRKNKM